MSIPKFCVSWNSYENNICNGFSRLRQHEEFVDMTIAAEGHLVKVHKSLIALASPYLKNMLQSASCQHPVIFLHNVSHKVLSYIIEYIYNGEVQVPSDMLSGFLEASMALHIQGVEHFVLPKYNPINSEDHLQRESNFAAHITINSENFDLEVQQFHNNIDHNYSVVNKEEVEKETVTYPTIQINSSAIVESQNNQDTLANDDCEENLMDLSATSDTITQVPNVSQSQNLIDFSGSSDLISQLPNVTQDTAAHKISQPQQLNNIDDEEIPAVTGLTGLSPQYTISNRGSLQLILNRHLYYFHHQSCGGRKRRWRCVDYRRMHCPAFIDTEGEAIMKREGIHCHAYHDSKIDKKRRKSLVYRSIASVEVGHRYYNENKLSEDEEDEIDMQVTAPKSLGTIT